MARRPGYPEHRLNRKPGECLRLPYGDEDRLEVLAGASARATVDVALEPIDQPETTPLEDLGVELAPVVPTMTHSGIRMESLSAPS